MEKPEQDTNSDFLLVSKPSLGRLKTMPMFALEKQTRLQWKQMHFILTLPVHVAGAVHVHVCIYMYLTFLNL